MELALVFILLHDPYGRTVLLNPDGIVSMRLGRDGAKNELVHERIRCVIATSDGKLVNVVESCDEIRELIKGGVR